MNYTCKKCNSEFELERDAADIFCPYCGYLAKSEDRNTFYERIHIIKPVISKKEFLISQIEKMARLSETPKDVFDNLIFDVKEKYIFYAEKEFSAKTTYDAKVKYKKEEKIIKNIEKTSIDKDGVKVTIKEPVEETRIVEDTKVISDIFNYSDSVIVNFKGATEKDLELIQNYNNEFEEDNSIEIPITNIRNVLKSYDELISKADDKYDKALKDLLCAKIKEKNGDCTDVDLKINECEYGDYKVYCVIKYTWDYKYNNTEYNLSTLASLKHVYGDYPADNVFEPMVKEEQDEIDKVFSKSILGIYLVSIIASIVVAVLVIMFEMEYNSENKINLGAIGLGLAFIAIIISLCALLVFLSKKKCSSKKEKIRKQRTKEKEEKKNIMCNKIIRDIKDDKYKL